MTGPFIATAAMRLPSCDIVTPSKAGDTTPTGSATALKVAPRSLDRKMPPARLTATMRFPSPETSEAIQIAPGRPAGSDQVCPPSVERLSMLLGMSLAWACPATITWPSSLDDSECHTSVGPGAVQFRPTAGAGAGAGAVLAPVPVPVPVPVPAYRQPAGWVLPRCRRRHRPHPHKR